jgi:hypothetical protein
MMKKIGSPDHPPTPPPSFPPRDDAISTPQAKLSRQARKLIFGMNPILNATKRNKNKENLGYLKLFQTT